MRASLVLPLLASLLLLGAAARPPGLADVEDVRVFDHGDHTRVVIEVSRPVRYRSAVLQTPPRFYLDLEATWIEREHREVRALSAGAAVRKVRGGQNTLRRARVVLELSGETARHETFHLERPFRIVTDIYPAEPPGPTRSPLARGEPETRGPSFDLRPVRRIAIDPGHGGKDPGAISRLGSVREKAVVLQVARALADQLERRGFDTLLTRSGDEYLTLEERTRRANEWGADVFVSLHANASRNRKTQGIETYLLDTRYDRQTARVAARENGTTVEELNELQMILASLRLGYNERFAARLADDVHGGLLGSLRQAYPRSARDLGVKRGPFLVLFAAEMPAILVELGFVSNRDEALRIRTKSFARTAAEGLTRGLVAYREEHARSLMASR